MSTVKRERVFWLGMHVVLTQTELPRLRALGYEVFNPPYLADVYDQSAVLRWDQAQGSTLPADVLGELSQFNFYYNPISPRIAELLNEYFGTVIVTCNPVWLHSMLPAFRGRVIYRVFGQASLQSDALCNLQLFRSIQERDDFHFVPHSVEAVRDDHSWLKTRMTVVPYALPPEVYEHEGAWSPEGSCAGEIMTCCPNIENPYYVRQYRYLAAHFPEPYIRLYGVQPRPQTDPRVVGTLERQELLARYRRSAGYWYHYDEPYVCYLPPIEMMTVGGPVIYMRGSLLAHYFPTPGPGEAADVEDAKRKLARLLAGDRGFIDEVRSSQAPVVRRYHPDHVQPIFDRAFRRLIDHTEVPRQEPIVLRAGAPRMSRKRVYVFFHSPGQHVAMKGGVYQATDQLGRTVRSIAGTVLEDTNHEVVVTCMADQVQSLYGLLGADRYPGRLRFDVLDHERLAPVTQKKLNTWLRPFRIQPGQATATAASPVAAKANLATATLPPPSVALLPIARSVTGDNWTSRIKDRGWSLAIGLAGMASKSRLLLRVLGLAAVALVQLLRVARRAKTWFAARLPQMRAMIVERKARLLTLLAPYWRAMKSPNPHIRRRDCIERLNREDGELVVIVPHGHLFPEALFLAKPMVLCLHDPEADRPRSNSLREKLKARIARSLAEKATAVLKGSALSPSGLFAAPGSRQQEPTAGSSNNRPQVGVRPHTQLEPQGTRCQE